MATQSDAVLALEILKGQRDGDRFDASAILAFRMEIEGAHIGLAHETNLADWLWEGDIEGDTTIQDLITEWNDQEFAE